jgi:signal transduction histidine kinase/DNA-binding NarL/FixJ family response regulator
MIVRVVGGGAAAPVSPVVHLGREHFNDLVFNDPSVSRQHATVWVRDGHAWIRDLGSSNGSFVNGQRVDKVSPVLDGDTLRLGEAVELVAEGRPTLRRDVVLLANHSAVFLPGGQSAARGVGSGPGGSVVVDGRTVPPNGAVVLDDRSYRVLEPGALREDTQPLYVQAPDVRVVARRRGPAIDALLECGGTGPGHRIGGNRAILLWLLAQQVARDRAAGRSPDQQGWIDDGTLAMGVWGRGYLNLDPSVLHVLLYRRRKVFERFGAPPRLRAEAARGHAAVGSDRPGGGHMSPRLLLLEDSPSDALLFHEHAVDAYETVRLTHVASMAEFLAVASAATWDVVVVDLNLPDSAGLDTVTRVIQACPDVAVVVLTGDSDPGLGARALRTGAHDFLSKDQLHAGDLRHAVAHAVRRAARAAAMRAALDESPVGVVVASDGCVVLANPVAVALGFAPGRPDAALTGHELHDDQGRTWSLSEHETRWQGELARLLHLRDISTFKSLQDRVRAQDQRLRELERLDALARLSGGLSHRINNALTSILGHAQLLEDATRDPGHADHADAIQRAGADLQALVAGIGSFAGQKPQSAAGFDVGELAGTRARWEHPDVRVTLTVQGQGRIRAAEAELVEVLCQLCRNAAEAHATALHVDVRRIHVDPELAATLAVEPGPAIALRAQDDGVGIDPATLPRVLEPFFSTRALGAGLGLSIAFGIVRSAHGAIQVTSAPTRGTCVEVTLPVLDQATRPQQTGAPPASRARHILLAEDDAQVRRLLKMVLTRMGFTVHAVSDGQAGLEALPADQIDLVVSDVDMPYKTGPEMVAVLRAARPALPVLYLSGFVCSDLPTVTTDARTRFLSKPFPLAALKQAVRDLMQNGPHGSDAALP